MTLRSIVGRGKHSDGGVPKIKPAAEELCRKLNLQVVPQKENPGKIYISLAAAKPAVSQTRSRFVSRKHTTLECAVPKYDYSPRQPPQYVYTQASRGKGVDVPQRLFSFPRILAGILFCFIFLYACSWGLKARRVDTPQIKASLPLTFWGIFYFFTVLLVIPSFSRIL